MSIVRAPWAFLRDILTGWAALARVSVRRFVGSCAWAVAAALSVILADLNPLVAEPGRKVLAKSLNVKESTVVKDERLYGCQRAEPTIAYLRAGPISLKFQDGELRYLRIGRKEIVRRIYFAVRDSRWDTVMPKFRTLEVHKEADTFRISMAATCENDVAGYQWQGTIVGAADGRITFALRGEATRDFQSPRVGLNVLYGAESLAGQQYEVSDGGAAIGSKAFPQAVWPPLLETEFQALRYVTADGAEVDCSLAETHFGMEDQRNFGDSSYKAFSSMEYSYPNVRKGRKAQQELTLTVTPGNAPAQPPEADPQPIELGGPVEAAAMPKFLLADDSLPADSHQPFRHYNASPRKYAKTAKITFRYNPALHMPDDDTFMENIPAIRDQCKTMRTFAPRAQLRAGLVLFDSPYPRPSRDPRNRGLFAAAWCARTMKYLALAGVEEAVFKVGPGYVDQLKKTMTPLAGRAILATKIAPHDAIDALAAAGPSGPVLWIINKTDQPQKASIRWPKPSARLKLLRLNASAAPGEPLDAAQASPAADGLLTLQLQPFEVITITPAEAVR